jgi:hypothetical protein
MKKCTNPNCKQPWKDETCFHRCRGTRDGLVFRCKDCIAEQTKAHYSRPESKEKAKQWRKTPFGRSSTVQAQRKYRTTEKHRNRITSDASRFDAGRRSAASRDLLWAISIDEWRETVSCNECHYCHGPLPTTGTGLDRKDNSRGYEVDNVVPCCMRCNRLKLNEFTYEEFMAFIVPGVLKIDSLRRQSELTRCQ